MSPGECGLSVGEAREGENRKRKREVGGKGSRTAKFDVEEREARNVACSKEESVRLSNACVLASLDTRVCVCTYECVPVRIHM